MSLSFFQTLSNKTSVTTFPNPAWCSLSHHPRLGTLSMTHTLGESESESEDVHLKFIRIVYSII